MTTSPTFVTPALPTIRRQYAPRSRVYMEATPPLSTPQRVVSKPGTRTPTFRKLQRRHQEGPRSFRESSQRAQELADLASRRKEAEVQARRERAQERLRLRAENARPLTELKVGEQLDGRVNNLVRHGAYVDVGSTRDGLVHVRDMAVQFLHRPEDLVAPGDSVSVWVKYVNPSTNTLGLTMRRPLQIGVERTKLADLEQGKRYKGIVERVTNFGAYVDIGAERPAFLHVRNLWGRRPRDTLEEFVLGQEVWVALLKVDKVKSYLTVSARGVGMMPLDKDGKVLVEEPKPKESKEPVLLRKVLARGNEEDAEEIAETKLNAADQAIAMLEEKSRNEMLVSKIGPVTQMVEWDEIRHMFDENSEILGIDDSFASDDDEDEDEDK